MKFREIFRFEFGYQARHFSTWLYFVLLLTVSFLMARNVFVAEALEGGYFLNAPFAVAQVTLVACLLSLPALAAFTGGAAARDIETRMHPILYTAPVEKFAYLGGRFFAAFALGALILLTIPLGILAAALLPGARAELIGPIEPAAYASAYLLLALPNGFIAMALMFAAAVFVRRGVASYLGAVFVLFASIISWQVIAALMGNWGLAKLTEPLGLSVFGELSKVWTPGEKNTLLVGTQTWMLLNRLAWIGAASGVLALTYLGFRLAHINVDGRKWFGRQTGTRLAAEKTFINAEQESARMASAANLRTLHVALPSVRLTFGIATRTFQMLAVARESFRVIVKWFGLIAVVALAAFLNLIGPLVFQDNGFPQIPTTGEFVNVLEQPGEHGMWLIIPFLTIYYAGELIWRERDAGLANIIDAAPVPVWVSFAGKFAGLALALAGAQTLLIGAAMLVQMRMGYYEFEIGLFFRILCGIRLADYLLFALLALIVHVLVNQKYVSHLILITAYVLVAFGPQFGIQPGLFIFGSDPGWTYSDMRGLDPFFVPWLLFKLYWIAWTLLLAVAAKLLWVRGTESGFGARLQTARRRCTKQTALTAAVAAGFVLTFGALIFYNTNVLYARHAAPSGTKWRADYERRYGQFANIPQPRPVSTNLRVEIHPARGAVEISGTYTLVNRTEAALDTIHVATVQEVETRIGFDRPAKTVLTDEELGHRIYILESPLRPGDSLQLEFEVRYAPRGFPGSEMDASVVRNGTFFGNEWLPRVGYQKGRELRGVAERAEHGLSEIPEMTPLEDAAGLSNDAGLEPIMFEAVVGTDDGQITVAPGALRREWTENGRRYFQYVTDAPIRNNFAFFSAAYAVREARWNDVEIQILYHPKHALNVDRMITGVQAALEYLTEKLGPYPHRQLRLVEHPGRSRTLFANSINIRYQEGFSFINAENDPRGIDLPFAVVAHEVAHQWWGNQLLPAAVVGAPLLTESLAWDSALEIVESHYGPEHRERLLNVMREDFLSPRASAGAPLLRATDRFQWYRKGVIALAALREYVGTERIDAALRRFFERHKLGATSLPTTLDLYRELQAVTPEEFRYLLADLFEANTYWELAAKHVEAKQIAPGEWQVTLDVGARKITVDEQGFETEIPMNDFVEIGVFGGAENGVFDRLYLEPRRIRSGEQRITVTVSKEPARAGIDPSNLLIDVKPEDNLREIVRP